MLTLRHTATLEVKLIWWYIAAVNEHKILADSTPRDKYDLQLCKCDDALQRLTCQGDQTVLSRAMEILHQTRALQVVDASSPLLAS